MSLSDLKKDHLSLVGRYHIRYSFRSGGAIAFTLVAIFTGLMIAHVFISLLNSVETNFREKQHIQVETKQLIDQAVTQFGHPVVGWALGDDEKWAAYLLDNYPSLLLAVYLVLLFSVPFVITLGAFNQVSGDIQHRSLRYLLLRTERANIFFGRFIGSYLFCLAVILFVLVTITLYFGLKLKLYSFGQILPLSLKTGLALAVLSMPYVALCSWLSASIGSAFGALFVSQLVIVFVPVAGVIAGQYWEPLYKLSYLLPWGIKFHLLHPDFEMQLLTIGAALLYTAIYLGLGYRTFTKRDL